MKHVILGSMLILGSMSPCQASEEILEITNESAEIIQGEEMIAPIEDDASLKKSQKDKKLKKIDHFRVWKDKIKKSSGNDKK